MEELNDTYDGFFLSQKISTIIVYIYKTDEQYSVSYPMSVQLGCLQGNQMSLQKLPVST